MSMSSRGPTAAGVADRRGLDLLTGAVSSPGSSVQGPSKRRSGSTSSDSSGAKPKTDSKSTPNVSSSKDFQFPFKVYDMLQASADNGWDAIVTWNNSPGGNPNSFKVLNTDSFVSTVMPRFFKHGRFKSFQRQLNLYVSVLPRRVSCVIPIKVSSSL